ncbi:hypothetical protein VARIO8X_90064 [Burkholderiales bacterium 8X]|nr:hypothetical protein VARIO8X_90064 [Burkholderiales bacterium 8X]
MYRWKTLWLGKLSPTRYHTTEEEIRKTHPEAVRIEGTLVVRMVPETDNERTPLHSSPPMPNK